MPEEPLEVTAPTATPETTATIEGAQTFVMLARETTLDLLVHVNALLPCLVVWWTLVIVESAYLAVFCYEFVLVAGPLLTL